MFMAERYLSMAGAGAIAVAHCNFNLRGEESDGDEAFVREWCERNGVEFICKSFDTSKYAVEKGISIEMAARDLRYAWFAQLCREHNDANVATLSGRFVDLEDNKHILEVFLSTDFAGGRHAARVEKIG